MLDLKGDNEMFSLGGGTHEYFKRANEIFSIGGGVKKNNGNERARCSCQIISKEQVRFSRQGVGDKN